MKKVILLCCVVLLASCLKDDTDFTAESEAAIIKYIADHKLDAKRSSTGLYYVINNKGTGAQPTTNSSVTVVYKGTFISGRVFDQSKAGGATFKLNEVIAGWREGMTYFKEGGDGILLIPSNLGYGNRGSGQIPGGAVLIFSVKLISVN